MKTAPIISQRGKHMTFIRPIPSTPEPRSFGWPSGIEGSARRGRERHAPLSPSAEMCGHQRRAAWPPQFATSQAVQSLRDIRPWSSAQASVSHGHDGAFVRVRRDGEKSIHVGVVFLDLIGGQRRVVIQAARIGVKSKPKAGNPLAADGVRIAHGSDPQHCDHDGHNAHRLTRLAVDQVASDLAVLALGEVFSGAQRAGVVRFDIAAGVEGRHAMRERAGDLSLQEGFDVHLSLHQRAGLPFRWSEYRANGPRLSTPVFHISIVQRSNENGRLL